MNLEVGKVYRAKKPAAVGNLFQAYYNDRVILWLSEDMVQYDSPAIRMGGKYKMIKRSLFEQWAAADVTDSLPPGEWAPYER